MDYSQHYIDNLHTHKHFKSIQNPVTIGIDEAGRGPVLGHLVYAAFISSDNVLYPDSKQTSIEVREKLFSEIYDKHSFIYTSIHPRYISHKMLGQTLEEGNKLNKQNHVNNINAKNKPEIFLPENILDINYALSRHKIEGNLITNDPIKQNLNQISHNTVINIIKEVQKQYKISKVIIDTIGPTQTLKKLLESHFQNIKIIVEEKADMKYGIVGGASIVAKYVRDNLMKGWQLSDCNCGSGYPSDVITRKWLERNVVAGGKVPEIVRRSWSTFKRIAGDRKVKVVKREEFLRKAAFTRKKK